MNPKTPLYLVIAILAAAALACGFNGPLPASPEVDSVATSVAATVQAGLGGAPAATAAPEDEPLPTAAPTDPGGVLPHAVYFLSEASGRSQVWRLERDSITLTRITDEAAPVEDFAVSPAGEVAYLVQNQIYTVLADGTARALIVDGGPPAETDRYFLFEKINRLAWSPDGLTLAYGRGGLNLYSILEGTSRLVLANEAHDTGGLLIADRIFFPESWSPDGGRLLVFLGFYEGGTFGVWDAAAGSFTQFQSQYNACCHAAWSPDGRTVLVASPYIGMIDPGLWRYDAATGAQNVLLPSQNPDGTLNFAGFPHEAGGSLTYFFANTPTFPDGNVPLIAVRAPVGDVRAFAILRPETWLLDDVLWASDASLALGIQAAPGSGGSPLLFGTLLLIPMDGSPVRPLAASAFNPQWGP
ncbi:MAG: hypothetical protein HYZ26_04780 [Chloroflexi bacterium]|nr:hypothetical protein [Chloroflexota bacterium]